MPVVEDPILERFRAALEDVYGERIERVVLFGSRARGDACPDSDCNIGVFLNDMKSFGIEAAVLAGIEAEILWDTGPIINAARFEAGSYRAHTGLMRELRCDGRDL